MYNTENIVQVKRLLLWLIRQERFVMETTEARPDNVASVILNSAEL